MNAPAYPGLAPDPTPDPGLVTYTHWMYALHAASALIGAFTGAFIATAFVGTLPSVIAVVMNYVKRSDARPTYLDSHFSWQLRTFWFAVVWVVVISLLSFPLVFLFGLGLVTWWVGGVLLGLWIIYRVARGWLRLRDAQPL
jgi:uncharacterized membrane protein